MHAPLDTLRPLETPRTWHVAALVAAMVFPTLTTWLYFVVLSGRDSMQPVYAGTKCLQFAFPLIWVLLVQRVRPRPARPTRRDLAWGLATGLAMVAAGLVAYFGYFKTSPWLTETGAMVQQKLVDMRLLELSAGSARGASPWRFGAFAAFLSLPHSGLEEYYWRWFVFGQLRRVVPLSLAIGLSSLAFMSHHVIVLDHFLPGAPGAVVLFSLCIAFGGAVWAWMYQRTGSLYGAWLSHLLVDAGIMYLGYDLVWSR
jgi:membrane protease YdiL (CAAX protease family)